MVQNSKAWGQTIIHVEGKKIKKQPLDASENGVYSVFSSLFSQQSSPHSSFTLLALFSQVVCNTMALCPPDGKIQMERSVVHEEMIMLVELIF